MEAVERLNRLDPAIRWATRAFVCAILSIVLQGYYFGVGNNVFHIPIVLKVFDDKSFQDDLLIQSLRNYTSLLYVVVTDSPIHIISTRFS